MTLPADNVLEALRTSLKEADRLRQRNRELASAASAPVAIVGMSCRFPGGVRDPEGLWELLVSGVDAITGFPQDRGWDDADQETAHPSQGGFLDKVAEFDPAFFGIGPREALAMDPQQRLLLECCWEAVEEGGIDPAGLRGSRTGVFAGMMHSDYAYMLAQHELPPGVESHLGLGGSGAVASGRVSYALGLEGPAVTVDTACSSALVALHLACQALRSGECDLALAGGVTVIVTSGVFGFGEKLGLSADGRCKAFSAAANGMGMAEGAGMLVVERLSDARRNGHRVQAVIRGSAVNQDGASNGLTAPNGPSQQRVIRAALASARLTADQVDAVEAHGTGTALGDPIEGQALIATYGQGRSPDRPLWLGSAKSNIGHTQAAAGVAGVIKMVLALRHQVLPRTLHAEEPSPHVDWSAGAVRLLTEPVPWTPGEHPRRAAVSSFGISGTNAHVVLEECCVLEEYRPAAEQCPRGGGSEPPVNLTGAVPWVVSGRTADGLCAQAGRLRDHLAARPGLAPVDVAWSLAATRSAFTHRAVITGADREELIAGLAAVAAGHPARQTVTGAVSPAGRRGRLVFVFPGHGAQWAGMGWELAVSSPVFAARLAQCGRALLPHTGWDLAAALAGEDGAPGREPRPGWGEAEIIQPLLWAVMVSLAALWQAAGIKPDAVVGHSQGEIAAACVAGILSLEDGAMVVARRSRALTGLAGRGGMISVVMPAAEARGLLKPWAERLTVAAINGPAATVVSGEPAALAEFEAELSARRVPRWRVPEQDFVAHSAQLEELAVSLRTDLATLRPGVAQIPFYSTVTCGWMDGPELDAGYWCDNMRHTVRFAEAIGALAESGHRTFVEVSPHPVLGGAIQETIEDVDPAAVPLITGTLLRDDGGVRQFLASLARVYVHGGAVDWAGMLKQAGGQRVDLPTYAFQRQRYWPTDSRDALFVEQWAPVPVTVQKSGPEGCWAVVGEDPLAVAAGLGDVGADVRAVADLAALVAAVEAGQPVPEVVLTCVLPKATDDQALAARAAVGQILALIQRWLAEERFEPARLVVLTRGAVAAGPGGHVSDLAGAAVWGLVRSAQSENPGRLALADLPAGPGDGVGSAAFGVLAAGLGSGEPELAVRDAIAYGRRLGRPAAGGPTALCRQEPWRAETVLITGGTGMLGGLVARHLARAGGARHLVLASRSGPAASDAAVLAADLASAGAGVQVMACDVADRDALAALMGRLPEGSPLTGVVHLAGVLDDGTIGSLTPARVDRVMRPKADAAWHLHQLTAGLDLKAFVLFSSTAATLGSPGQGNYAAANAFLDALATSRRVAGLPGTSLAWGLWVGDSAMTGHLSERERGRLASVVVPLAVDEGLALLDAAVGRDEAMLVTARFNTANLGAAARVGVLPALLHGLAGVPVRPRVKPGQARSQARELRDRLASANAADRERILLDLVRGEVASVLGHDSAQAVDVDLSFLELGLDSLTLVQFRNRVRDATGLRLSASAVFEYPGPALLAGQLHAQLSASGLATGDAVGQPGGRGGPDIRRYVALPDAEPLVSADAARPAYTMAGPYLRAARVGQTGQIMKLIKGLAAFRPAFAGPSELTNIPHPVLITRGPATPGVICFPSFPGTGPQEYARFAAGFRGIRQVSVIPAPGITEGEPLAATVDALASVHAENIRRSASGAPFVLAGHSSGGLVAHAVATRLQETGPAPAALVLVDAYSPGRSELSEEAWSLVPAVAMPESQRRGEPLEDAWFTAVAHYFSLDWSVLAQTDLPTLLVRAAEPLGGSRALSWDLSSDVTVTDVPGDHFTMMAEHAATTAGAVNDWLAHSR
jgi:acyl transferase domain-containing protein/acyl carrier protein